MATKAQINVKVGALTEGFDKGMKRLERKLKRTGRLLKKTGTAMTQNFTAPIVAMGAMSVKVFADFEQGMLKVKAISGATNTEMNELTDTAKRLGSTTMFTATQVSELQLSLSKLGLTPTEINKSTESILNLAQATDSDLAQSATIAASTMRAFGLEAEDMTSIVDVMADAISSSALDMSKFDTAMSSVAPVARVAGASLEQTTAIIGVLTNNGVEASTAGTALRNIFLDLAKNGMSWSDAMDQINNAVDPLATAFDLFGKRGANVATIIANNGEEIRNLTADFEDSEGEAQRMADIMDSGLSGSLRKLKSAAEGAGIEMGQGLKPIIESIAKTLQNVAYWFRDLSDSQKENVIQIGLIVAAIGPILIMFGKLSLGAAAAAKAMQRLNKFIVANPYLALSMALGVVSLKVYNYVTALTTQERIQKKLQQIQRNAIADTKVEVNAINEKLRLARNIEASDADREKAVRSLNKEIRSLNGQLTLENINEKRVTASIKEHTDAIIANAAAAGSKKRLEEEVMELERLKDVQDDLFKAFLENVTDAQLFQFGFKSGDWDRFSYAVEFAEKKTQHLNEGIEEQQKVVDGIADSIVDYTKKSAILTEELSLSEIMSKNYGNTISGLNQKLSELTNVYENAEKGSSDYNTATKEIKKVSKELAKEYDKLAVKTGGSGNNSVTGAMQKLNQEIQELTQQFYNAELAGDDTSDILTKLKTKTDQQKDAQEKLNKALATESDILKENNKLITERINKTTGRKEQVTYGSIEEMQGDTSGTGGTVTGIFNEFSGEFESLNKEINGTWDNIVNGMENFGHKWIGEWKNTVSGIIAVVDQLDQTFDAYFKMQTQKINNQNKEQLDAIDQEEEARRASLMNITDDEKRAAALERLDDEFSQRRADIEEETQEKLNKIKRQQAIKDKAVAIFQATINGVGAVISALKFGPIAAIAVGALVAAQIAMIAATPIPKFADGGIVSAPTLGIMGEYSTAKTNPEVIAPLDRLKSMIGDTGQNIVVTGRLRGNDIYLSNENAATNRLRTS